MEKFQPAQFGKYLLLDKIAVGGMAELYRAKIIGVEGFEKLIAVKMILPHLSLEEDLVSSFICEAKLAAFLQHQNIVQIYDFGRMENRYFIAMEYLFGKDLKAVIRKSKERKQPISLENSLYMISQVCKGLDYAHHLRDFNGTPLSIIHRDIGPQNIFITYDGEVKIIDFGIAKAAIQDRTTQAGSIKGKVAYMSPEQAEGKAVDHRSDIFAIGIMLYELVLERRMFSGDIYEVFKKVRESDFAAPESLNKDLPPRLYEILHKALARNPEMRYQSSGEMLIDIDAFMAERAYRPNERSLSTFIRGLFQSEADSEMTAMHEAAKLKIVSESARATVPVTIMSPQKTLALPRKELENADKKPARFIVPVAAVAFVIFVFGLGFYFLKGSVPRIDGIISRLHESDVMQEKSTDTDVIDSADPYLTSILEAETLLQ
ncbi:MAG: serine/threonine protein kinase, partial [Deltaproteobacteria bacterium]|nr:serine/threonine protein kinase [Deltaproteobacteria bacterium]